MRHTPGAESRGQAHPVAYNRHKPVLRDAGVAVLKALTTKGTVLWDVPPCSLSEVHES
jgi:hypothetical protein